MERIKEMWNKKTVYFICVLAFNYIEFIRATGDGDAWKTAANCTGLVMMVIIFSACPINVFLNITNYIYTALCVGTMILVRFHWEQHIGEYSLWQVETAIMNIWWLGLMFRYLCRQIFVTKQILLRISALGWLWIIMVVWTVIGVSGKLWPLWFFLVFGCFYVVRFSKQDWNDLINAILNGTIFSFFVIQSYAYLFRPYDEVRYKGAYANCNNMALYYVIVYVIILVKIHQLHVRKAKMGWKLFYFVGAGGLLAFQFMTICRTAWLTSIIITICYGVMVICKLWHEKIGKVFAKGSLLVICTLLTFLPVFYTVRYLPTIHPHPIWYGGEYGSAKVHSWDPANSEKYVDLDEFLDAALGRVYSLLKIADAKNPFVLKVTAKELVSKEEPTYVDNIDIGGGDSSIGVRIALWKEYLRNATWRGHSPENENFAWESNGRNIWHAQNVWVQFAYTFGYPVGILFVIATVLILVRACKGVKICKEPYGIMPIMLCLVFFCFGLAEIVWSPGQYVFTLFFFVLHPQFFITGDKKDVECLTECSVDCERC